METVLMNTENSKQNKPHKFALNFYKDQTSKNLNKRVALQNLLIYYTWKNIRQKYKNNKQKIITPNME